MSGNNYLVIPCYASPVYTSYSYEVMAQVLFMINIFH